MFTGAEKFLETVFSFLDRCGFDYSNFKLDHIAYKCASIQEYATATKEFAKENQLVSEHIFSGIHVSVFRLKHPLIYKKYLIEIAELIEPKPGEMANSSIEHIEMIPDLSLYEVVDKYPQLNWDTSNINRDQLPAIKLKLDQFICVKFPARSIIETLRREGKIS